ncbi:MAG: PEGA domain-containing protein [Candidatus Portnoybacteria bacterium]|nr:PEGA domain-containing protein [Candidatus Portnoybacteria bacterium]
MTRKTRRIIFYLFVMIFIVVVPMIIFYALGYNFDFEKKTIVATGGIYLKSDPSRAEIYINDKLKTTTNKLIKRLSPKIYNVKITKENFHPWEKNLIVQPNLVTKANNIILLPVNPKISLVATESQEYISFVAEKKPELYYVLKNNLYRTSDKKLLMQNVANYVIYKDGIIYLDNVNGNILELDLTTLKSAQMFDQVFPSLNKGKWTLSNDNKKLLCQKDKSVEILWLDDITNNSIIRKKGDLDKIDFNQTINNVIWYSKTDEHLIVSTDNSILFTELDNRLPRNTINYITAENSEIKYDSSNRILYFLSQDKLYQTEL